MRIIAGSAKGRVLRAPQGRGVRPTLGRARETLFGALGERVVGARFLDLFAGVGAVGLEALSRGAGEAVLVERSHVNARFIRENLRACGFTTQAAVWQVSVSVALRRLTEAGRQFDIAFCDPPYQSGWGAKVVAWVEEHRQLLSEGGLLILQDHHKVAPPTGERWRMVDERRIGDTRFTFYQAMVNG